MQLVAKGKFAAGKCNCGLVFKAYRWVGQWFERFVRVFFFFSCGGDCVFSAP
jgi:predicted metal-binding protein